MEGAINEVIANVPATEGPIILTDGCDLTGGGGPGDDVTTLTKLLAAGAKNITAVIYDPETVQQAVTLGKDAKGIFHIGGKYGLFAIPAVSPSYPRLP